MIDMVPHTKGFLSELSWNDLQKLRLVVKRVHMVHYPSDKVTDHEADKIIEALGPDIMQKEIEDAARGGVFKGY